MLYNRCTGIYKFGNNTYPRCIRRRSNLGQIFWGKKCVLWAGKYGKSRIARAKAEFNKKKTLFTSKLDLNLRKKLVKCYIWSMAL